MLNKFLAVLFLVFGFCLGWFGRTFSQTSRWRGGEDLVFVADYQHISISAALRVSNPALAAKTKLIIMAFTNKIQACLYEDDESADKSLQILASHLLVFSKKELGKDRGEMAQ